MLLLQLVLLLLLLWPIDHCRLWGPNDLCRLLLLVLQQLLLLRLQLLLTLRNG